MIQEMLLLLLCRTRRLPLTYVCNRFSTFIMLCHVGTPRPLHLYHNDNCSECPLAMIHLLANCWLRYWAGFLVIRPQVCKSNITCLFLSRSGPFLLNVVNQPCWGILLIILSCSFSYIISFRFC